jgi:hypothetical protein
MQISVRAVIARQDIEMLLKAHKAEMVKAGAMVAESHTVRGSWPYSRVRFRTRIRGGLLSLINPQLTMLTSRGYQNVQIVTMKLLDLCQAHEDFCMQLRGT